MGTSQGLETRVLEFFVIECLSCSLLSPPRQKSFFKVKIKKFQTQEEEEEEEEETNNNNNNDNKQKNRKEDGTKTKHPQIITYKKPKKALCWKFYPAYFLNKSFKPS